jgi:RNA-directed DNA polymerase
VARRPQEGPCCTDLSARTGATGDDPEAWRWRAAPRHPDDPGPGGADRRQLVLEPIFEADLEPAAHGYRPGRSGTDAIQAVHALLCRGYTDVVDADLSQYFDTIPHQDLMRSVARHIVDRHALRLIKLWLEAPVEERDADGARRLTGGKGSRQGTPQGGEITP